MSRSVIAGAALIAAAAVVPQLPVAAQDNSSITVSAPAARAARNAGQPRNMANPRMELVSNVSVSTADLDLRTAYGRAVLDARIRLAADAACDRIDEIDPPVGVGGWSSDKGNCRHLAMKRAQTQRGAAIRADG